MIILVHFYKLIERSDAKHYRHKSHVPVVRTTAVQNSGQTSKLESLIFLLTHSLSRSSKSALHKFLDSKDKIALFALESRNL